MTVDKNNKIISSRKDIEGLKFLFISCFILFNFNFKIFNFAFVIVDLFFVIVGYVTFSKLINKYMPANIDIIFSYYTPNYIIIYYSNVSLRAYIPESKDPTIGTDLIPLVR